MDIFFGEIPGFYTLLYLLIGYVNGDILGKFFIRMISNFR